MKKKKSLHGGHIKSIVSGRPTSLGECQAAITAASVLLALPPFQTWLFLEMTKIDNFLWVFSGSYLLPFFLKKSSNNPMLEASGLVII